MAVKVVFTNVCYLAKAYYIKKIYINYQIF